MSLPLAFATTAETIPADVPYLQPDPQLIDYWRHRLESFHQLLKVGLVWAGRDTHKNDRNRSVPLCMLAPLASVPGVEFFSLQLGAAGAAAGSTAGGFTPIDFTREFRDFADTAAMIANLDLVITVDTAVAHLAGAMGKPVWTLLPFVPDWRWMLDRDDSPWYPTMRLFRQPARGDWNNVVEMLKQSLHQRSRIGR